MLQVVCMVCRYAFDNIPLTLQPAVHEVGKQSLQLLFGKEFQGCK